MKDADRPAAPQEDQKQEGAVLRDREQDVRPDKGKAGKVPPDGEIIGDLGDAVGGPA